MKPPRRYLEIYAYGRRLIVYRSGLLSWSFSVDGAPVGKSYLTKARARRSAIQAAERRRHEAPL